MEFYYGIETAASQFYYFNMNNKHISTNVYLTWREIFRKKIIINKHDFEFVTVFFVVFRLSEHEYTRF